jgi:hypothetical protein
MDGEDECCGKRRCINEEGAGREWTGNDWRWNFRCRRWRKLWFKDDDEIDTGSQVLWGMLSERQFGDVAMAFERDAIVVDDNGGGVEAGLDW